MERKNVQLWKRALSKGWKNHEFVWNKRELIDSAPRYLVKTPWSWNNQIVSIFITHLVSTNYQEKRIALLRRKEPSRVWNKTKK